ncbi:hypothetical protein [Mycobacteroides immunogenum]|uniref:Uncharacterized protein n=1 Tax=Mycobacteroides immunogenum TaxID=83262 RepID=A0A7V8LL18_9MYCO|nr:hypothetical protein [Mycobacteroides immunogenum]AMT70598.1 hypothetical protein ABG82_10045 [Mycobacteroides immunogenum]ANO03682.1 hypothetical protein BAB75_10100 [Mycobacteroides immunogenum]KIU38031.1 hypothetical protein TL11_24445 [Mycobacteroides immunogenum]KPG04549.1 hypothetical protein AN909_22540 [Mycobacteroides immunogenum]KPG05311.1 hypothetical protein AN908_23040 [Mycobacteroides immunogenum]
MKIVPAAIQQHVDRIDRQQSLYFGIGSGLVAFWSIYRVFWSLYLSATYSFVFGSLIFPIVLWGVIGTVAAITSVAFFTRYKSVDNNTNQQNSHEQL